MKYLKKFESHSGANFISDRISELQDQFEDLELDFDIDVKVDYSYFNEYYIVDIVLNQKIDFKTLLDLIKSRVDRVRSTTDFKTRGISDPGNHDVSFNPNISDYYGILYRDIGQNQLCFGDLVFRDFVKWLESYDGPMKSEEIEYLNRYYRGVRLYNEWVSVKKVRILFDV